MWSRLEPKSLPISCLDRPAIRRWSQAIGQARPCESAAELLGNEQII
jgi:hypothetical protein